MMVRGVLRNRLTYVVPSSRRDAMGEMRIRATRAPRTAEPIAAQKVSCRFTQKAPGTSYWANRLAKSVR